MLLGGKLRTSAVRCGACAKDAAKLLYVLHLHTHAALEFSHGLNPTTPNPIQGPGSSVLGRTVVFTVGTIEALPTSTSKLGTKKF